jgi:hypothetical protein
MGAFITKALGGGPRPMFQHNVTLPCKDEDDAQKMFDTLRTIGLPGAKGCNAYSYEFGLEVGSKTKVWVVEKWYKWEDLDAHLEKNVTPNLDDFNALMPEPFDPAKHTTRIELVD